MTKQKGIVQSARLTRRRRRIGVQPISSDFAVQEMSMSLFCITGLAVLGLVFKTSGKSMGVSVRCLAYPTRVNQI